MRRSDDIGAFDMELEETTSSYVGNVNPNYVTTLTPQVLPDGNAGLLINGTNERVFFPVPAQPREFATLDAFYNWSLANLGAQVAGYDANNQRAGLAYHWEMHGYTFFYDGQTGAFWNINNPILAYLGGTAGTIKINGQQMCIDPDGQCGGMPSYMSLEGGYTGDTVVFGDSGTTQLVVYHTNMESAFWDPLFSYVSGGSQTEVVRHTARIRFCTGQPTQPGENRVSNVFGTGTDVCILFATNPAQSLNTRSTFWEATPGGYSGANYSLLGTVTNYPRVNRGFIILAGQAWFSPANSADRILFGSNRACSSGDHHNVAALPDGVNIHTEDGFLGWTHCTGYP